ncbi:hypothetical protein CDAR_292171 [Caerostris darwini]|uniref:Uncharacterized protein n=1 Tax=Caerostris darwini TaxID=1538125 RepID=A0AAV4V2S5_9ARAC|nr:hypothetical protein CDAR_292171 [Caerostris darwini]
MTSVFYLAKNSFSSSRTKHQLVQSQFGNSSRNIFRGIFREITREENGMARGASESPSDCKLHSKRYIRAAEQFCCLPQMAGDKLTRIIPPFIQRGR